MQFGDLLQSLKTICVLVTVIYLASRTKAFAPVISHSAKAKERILVLALFGMLGIVEVLLIHRTTPLDARVISATAAGLFGGATVGMGVGALVMALSVGLAGASGWAVSLPAIVGGALGGWVYAYRSHFGSKVVAGFLVGALSHGIWLGLNYSGHYLVDSWGAIAVEHIMPMLLSGAGVSIFLVILGDMRAHRERIERSELAKAIGLANRMLPTAGVGLDREGAEYIAAMVRSLTGLPRVDIVSSDSMLLARSGDGRDMPSAATNPLYYRGKAVGSVVLYQTSGGRIQPEVRELGEEVAQFLLNYRMQLADIEHQTQAVSRAELKALQAQVHPHFLFNALNTIVSLCEIDPRRAAALTVRLGDFFRTSLRSDNGLVSTLNEELAVVRGYLDIERARFGDRLEVLEEVDPAAGGCRLPSFTLQPLVENAILHGVSRKTGAGRVRIVVRRRGNRMVCWVTDNGQGFDPAARPSDNGSHALPMLVGRLDKAYGAGAGVRIRSHTGEGTVVCLWVPAN